MERKATFARPATFAGASIRLLAAVGIVITSVAPTVVAQQSAATSSKAAPTLSVQPTTSPDGWAVRVGDELFAGYRTDVSGTPIIFPLVAPGGHHVTRGFPMVPAKESEKSDHDHHRSMWFNHGEVNGIDFWLDEDHCGKIVQTAGQASVDADTGAAVIETRNDWVGPDGQRILQDARRFTFFDDGKRRWIDCDLTLLASDGDVNFGDTKEGSFGIRVAGTMKVDAKLGGKITNAEGLHDGEAWGKKSSWVDYAGPVDGETVGITAHYHPSSFNYPCRWHVRTYGLFAANPFGDAHFTGEEPTEGVTLADGETLTLSLRVVLREGEFEAAVSQQDFDDYAKSQRPELNATAKPQ